ncbi:hypothetical protein As57867_020268, partial [Aphanomyces stellatus]
EAQLRRGHVGIKSPLEISLQAAGLIKLQLSNLPRTPQVKIKKASSAAALKMSKQASNPLRETITPARGSDGPIPVIGVSTNPGQEVGVGNALLPNPGVSNPLLTPNSSSVSVQAGGPSTSDSPPRSESTGGQPFSPSPSGSGARASMQVLSKQGRCSRPQMSSQELAETGDEAGGGGCV